MKKFIGSMVTLAVLLLCIPSIAGAATTSGDMYKAVDKFLSSAHYDYNEGSLVLKHKKTIKLDEPVQDMNKITAAIAHFETVRMGIFAISHKEDVFFSPKTGETIARATAAKSSKVKSYVEQYKTAQDMRIHLGFIMAILALMIVVPGFIMYVWAKRHHSVLTYQLENNLLDDVGDGNYR